MMPNMLIPIGHHRSASVPPALADDMHFSCQKGVGRPHHASDVEVVLPVLDRDVKTMASLIEIGHDRVATPIAVSINDIAPITGREQLRVEAWVVWPRLLMRPHADDVHPGQPKPATTLALVRLLIELLTTRALGPEWLDPQQMIEGLGPWAMVGITAIIFAECGLLIGFFLPGDSLLFVAGLLVANGFISTPIALACLIFTIAAIAGNVVGYGIGRKAGPTIFRRPDSRLFRQEYVDKTQLFFDHHGPRAIVLARFVPIVRTFITVIAGVGRMNYRTYFIFSTLGGIIWATGLTLLGYYLGEVTFIADNLEIIAIGIVVLSFIPVYFELRRHRRTNPSADTAADS